MQVIETNQGQFISGDKFLYFRFIASFTEIILVHAAFEILHTEKKTEIGDLSHRFNRKGF